MRHLTAIRLTSLFLVALAALLFAYSPQPAQAQTAANPEGVLWQAKITPAQHNQNHLSHITGWSHGAYGTIDGSRTFTENGVTFTMHWLAHSSTDSNILLNVGRSGSAAFAEATLCAGALEVTIPAQAAGSGNFSIAISGAAATPPWTNGVPVGVGIVRSPATCASITTGIVWQGEMTPQVHPTTNTVTGWSAFGDMHGSINGGRTFSEGGATFTVRRLQHNSGNSVLLLNMSVSATTATLAAGTMCLGNQAEAFSEESTSTGTMTLSAGTTSTSPWTTGTALKVGIVRAPSTCDAITGGIVWRAEMTPGNYQAFPGVTGWSHNAYGSIDGDRTFPDGGATFTVGGGVAQQQHLLHSTQHVRQSCVRHV